MRRRSEESQRLETALRWLESHHKRLGIQKRALEQQLQDLDQELDRVAGEIRTASDRLEHLQKS